MIQSQTRRRWTKFIWPGLLVLVLVVGAGAYWWQHHNVNKLNGQVSQLKGQVSSLQDQLKASQQAKKPATPVSSTPAAPGSCQGSDMKLALGQANGTAGTTYIDAIFTNTTKKACVLQGYPVVTLSNNNSQTIGQQATQSGGSGSSTVTVNPGKSAHVALGFPDPGALSPGTCSQAAQVDVTLPGDSTVLQAATGQQYCPGFSVSAVEPGS